MLNKSALVELSGPSGGGKTEAALRMLAADPAPRVAWIESQLTVFPCAFPQNGVALERVLFIECHEQTPAPQELVKDLVWAAQQALRSQLFGAVVVKVETPFEELILRRLQLAAERSQASVILICEEATRQGAWPISAQIEVTRSAASGAPLMKVLRERGQRVWDFRVG